MSRVLLVVMVLGVHQKSKSLSYVRLFATTWTIQSTEFARPEYWTGYPFPSPGDLPNPGIKPRSPTLQADSLPAEPQGKPQFIKSYTLNMYSFLHVNHTSIKWFLKNELFIELSSVFTLTLLQEEKLTTEMQLLESDNAMLCLYFLTAV